MRQLAFDAARVLKRNYPEYKIEEINRNILVSKINTSEDQIDLDSSGEDDSWYNIFNIFN